MALIHSIFSSQGLKALRVVQLVVVLAAIAGVGLSSYRLAATVSALCRANMELKHSRAEFMKLAADASWNTRGASEYSTVESSLQYTDYISTFIRQITQLAKVNGCILKAISPKPAETVVEDKEKTISFRPAEVGIEMTGPYAGVDGFIDGLSHLPKVAKVTEIDLSRKSVDRSTRKILVNAKLTLVLCMIEPSEKPR